MQIERIVNFYNSQNCYLVFDENKNGIIIDPGSESSEIEEVINNFGVKVSHIFLTHCHYDHIGGLDGIMWNIRKIVTYFRRDLKSGKIDVHVPVMESWDGIYAMLKKSKLLKEIPVFPVSAPHRSSSSLTAERTKSSLFLKIISHFFFASTLH